MPLSRSLQQARQAYRDNDAAASAAAHASRATEQHRHEQGRYIKSAVYGGLDGIVTTFAVVAGVAGAALSSGVVLILGFANLLADGLSMAIGDYLSTRAEQQYEAAERQREQWEVEHYPEGEKRELIELYVDKGMPEADAEKIVDILSRHQQAWVDVMMTEELGIVESTESPLANALVTFCSFALFGLVPLLVYLLARFAPALGAHTFVIASLATAMTLFVLGALKVRVTGQHWFRSGLETLVVGGLAAIAAYAVGAVLGGLA